MSPKQRAWQEDQEIQKLQNYDSEHDAPHRYVITKQWQHRWLAFLKTMKDGTSQEVEYQEELLRRAFHSDGEDFIETYIKGSKSVASLTKTEKTEIYDLVPASIFYFFYYLYYDPDQALPPPCIMPSPEIPTHLKEREKNKNAYSEQSEGASERRGGKG